MSAIIKLGLFCFALHKVSCQPIGIYADNGVLVREVTHGRTVILTCRSNDRDHIFDFWYVHNKGLVIGPSNQEYDNGKFNYEILSGNLTIRAVTKQEEGEYICVSREVKSGSGVKIDMVKMLVRKDWEDMYEHNTKINQIRIIIVLITLVLVSIGIYVVYKIWKDRYIYPSYLETDEDDDESADEIFRAPSTSGISRSKSPTNIVIDKSRTDGFEDLSTDFKSILDTANDK